MSINHVGLPTGARHFKLMRDFYARTLRPLGYRTYVDIDGAMLGMSGARGPDFWLIAGEREFERIDPAVASKKDHLAHVAFDAASRAQVDEWYRVAIAAGGVSNGEPGERQYQKGYYAAYVLDPLGNNIEAVYWKPLQLRAIAAAPWIAMGLVGGLFGVAATMYMN